MSGSIPTFGFDHPSFSLALDGSARRVSHLRATLDSGTLRVSKGNVESAILAPLVVGDVVVDGRCLQREEFGMGLGVEMDLVGACLWCSYTAIS